SYLSLFFYNASSPTELYSLSLHDALPISVDFQPAAMAVEDMFYDRKPKTGAAFLAASLHIHAVKALGQAGNCVPWYAFSIIFYRSEEHTSELQSRENLVCRLLLEKKKK